MRGNRTGKDDSPKYRLIGTRLDGSRSTVLRSMTIDEAMWALEAVRKEGIFARVHIATDHATEIWRRN